MKIKCIVKILRNKMESLVKKFKDLALLLRALISVADI